MRKTIRTTVQECNQTKTKGEVCVNRKPVFANICTVFLILWFVVLGAGNLSGAPYKGEVFRLKQPDGSHVEVKVWGDEFYQRVESMDGYTLVRDSDTGWICYAELSEDESSFIPTDAIYRGVAAVKADSLKSKRTGLRLRKKLKLNKEAIMKNVKEAQVSLFSGTQEPKDGPEQSLESPAVSTSESRSIVGLTLLIDFPDVPWDINRAEIDDFLNQIDYNGFGNNGSVSDYFYDVSGGKLTYTNLVNEYYTTAKNKGYYTTKRVKYGKRARQLIRNALRALDADGFDFSTLTTNSSGRILAINALYAGEVDNSWAKGLWPHCSYLWPPFKADGVYALRYQIMNIGSLDPNIGSPLKLRVFCHENGHMLFRWPDLYDYGHQSAGVGNYCLMAYGGLNRNPVPPNPYFRGLRGWETIIEISGDTVGSVYCHEANSLSTYRFSNFDNPREFFLIESRLRTGRDANLPDEGLIIWHIDKDGSNNYEQMTRRRHYKVSVEQADGMFHLERGSNAGDANDLFDAADSNSFDDYTQPAARWWNGEQSGLAISSISEVGPTMCFFAVKNIRIQKCRVKAGKTKKGEPDRGSLGFVARDSISVYGQMDATVDDINNADEIYVEIRSDSNDYLVYSEAIDLYLFRANRGKYTYKKKIPKGVPGAITSFILDLNKHTFSLQAKDANLTGLDCLLSVEIEIGDYFGAGQAGEDIVNGKKPIPIQLMSGYADTFRVDKVRIKSGKRGDSLSVKGAFALENEPNSIGDVVITLGSQDFSIPGGKFISKGSTEICKKVEINNGIASAKFDPVKCSFIITIKNASIDSTSGTVNFGISAFGSFNQTVEVDL